MEWIVFLSILIIAIWQVFILRRQLITHEGFELLLTKFIEVNQEFYEGQKLVAKKDKDVLDELFKMTAELNILKKYSKQTDINLNKISDAINSLKEIETKLQSDIDELVISKDIANALATVSGNIKVLDSIVGQLRKTIEDLKRRKNANQYV